jgi:IMP dehydrogenase
MERHGVGGLAVLEDGSAKLAGLITRRDILLAPESLTTVKAAMTPFERLVTAQPGVTVQEAREALYCHRVEKLPVVDSTGVLLGLITAQDVSRPHENPSASLDEKGRLMVGAAIGVTANEMERAAALLEAGADALVLDIAHGHADHCIKMVRDIRSQFAQAQIIAGNVASRDGARELAEAGASAIKVGIGPGSICTTRIVTGFGVPQLTAIIDSVEGVRESGIDIPVIADGGIQKAGDLVKALAAGAETVMVGSLFAGTEEAPGSPVIRDGQKVKVVRGMASLGATMGRRAAERGQDESAEDAEDWDKVVPEGVEAVVPYRGLVSEVLTQLVGGLRSGLSYGGAHNIKELQENAEFIEITPAGVKESGSHDVRKI